MLMTKEKNRSLTVRALRTAGTLELAAAKERAQAVPLAPPASRDA
jgi:hypothetical protein